jgi:type VI protein secretion system component Hcp
MVAVLLISHVAIAQYAKEIPTYSRAMVAENAGEISKSPICHVTITGVKGAGPWPPEHGAIPSNKTLEAFRFLFEMVTGTGEKKQIGMTAIGTEQKTHGQLTITTKIGPATIGLYNAWITNKELHEVKIDFLQATQDPKQGKNYYYTITLNNAKISNINQFSDGTSLLQDISFISSDVDLQQATGGSLKQSGAHK